MLLQKHIVLHLQLQVHALDDVSCIVVVVMLFETSLIKGEFEDEVSRVSKLELTEWHIRASEKYFKANIVGCVDSWFTILFVGMVAGAGFFSLKRHASNHP